MNKYEGLICPICRAKLFEDDDIAVCPVCGAPHHRQCFKHAGHCFYESTHGTENQWNPPLEIKSKSDIESSETDKIRCPACGTSLPPDSLCCFHCGAPLNKPQSRPFSPPQSGVPLTNTITIDENEIIDGVSVKDLAPMIRMNIFRYINVFRAIATGKKTGWNWAAFLIPEYWFFYRKCYFPGIIISTIRFLLMAVLSMLFSQTVFSQTYSPTQIAVLGIEGIIILTISVIIGIFGDLIYKNHVYKALAKFKNNDITDPSIIAAKGGISFLAPVMVYFIFGALQLFLPLILK